MTLKDKIIDYLEKKGKQKNSYRIKYFKCSRYQKRYKPEYQQEECWIYPKEVVKRQRQKMIKGIVYNVVDKYGNPVMESNSGLLVTIDDFENEDYREMMLNNF